MHKDEVGQRKAWDVKGVRIRIAETEMQIHKCICAQKKWKMLM